MFIHRFVWVSICMYICIYICIYVCMHIHVITRIHDDVCMNIYASQDGKFIDEQTQSLQVQFVTYNVPHDIFFLSTVDFKWLVGGKIQWSSDHGSISPRSKFSQVGSSLLRTTIVKLTCV